MKTLILLTSIILLTSCAHTQHSTYQPVNQTPYQHPSYSQPTGYHVVPSGQYEGYQGGYDITPQ